MLTSPSTPRSRRGIATRARLAALLAVLAAPAAALDPCAADAQRLCSRARGDVAVLGCLRTQEKEVTPACRANLAGLLEVAAEMGKDCEADARKLCADVVPGEGRVLQCLRDNESFVSQSCQRAFNEVRLVRSRLQASCAGDVGNFCRDVPEGQARIVACLRKHEKDLTSDCRDVLKKLPKPARR